MNHKTVLHLQALRIDTPILRRGPNQPDACGCAGLAESFPLGSGAGTAARYLNSENRMVVDLIDRSCFKANIRPVRLELFGDEHRQRSVNALAHLRLVYDYRNNVVGAYPNKGVGSKGGRWLGNCFAVEPVCGFS